MRPINPASERQQQPWLAARVSRRTYYKAKKTLALAKWPNDRPIHAQELIDYAPLLRAMQRDNPSSSLADIVQMHLAHGMAPTGSPVCDYITHNEAQKMDQQKGQRVAEAKKGRNEYASTSHPENERPS